MVSNYNGAWGKSPPRSQVLAGRTEVRRAPVLSATPSPLAERIYAAVRCIPRGKVATYSQIAALAGNRNLRRYVGNTLHKNPDNSFTPCHRVVNAKGFCSGSFSFGGPLVQQEKLEAEGVRFTQGHVDMERFCITEDDFEEMHLMLENALRGE